VLLGSIALDPQPFLAPKETTVFLDLLRSLLAVITKLLLVTTSLTLTSLCVSDAPLDSNVELLSKKLSLVLKVVTAPRELQTILTINVVSVLMAHSKDSVICLSARPAKKASCAILKVLQI
jgi:hypothetical protein